MENINAWTKFIEFLNSDFMLVLAGAIASGLISITLFIANGIRERKNQKRYELIRLDGLIELFAVYRESLFNNILHKTVSLKMYNLAPNVGENEKNQFEHFKIASNKEN